MDLSQRMIRGNSKYNWIIAVLLLVIVLVGLGMVNYQFSKNNPGGNDYLVHYIGARSFFFEGLSPYSDEVAIKIQMAAYGHPAQGVEHELRVAYPLYSIFLFAPFSLIENYTLSRAIWMTALEIGLVIMTIISFGLFNWKPHIGYQAMILLFSLVWYHAVRGVVNGNAVILVALLTTVSLLAIKNNLDGLAGISLAIMTIKPHLVVLFIAFIITWSIYQKRWKLIFWFFFGMAVFIGIGFWLIPDWIYQNIWEILKYPEYNPPGTLATALGEWLPTYERSLRWGIGILTGLLLLYEIWQARKAKFPHFLWAALVVIVYSQWVGIQTDPGNFILLFPALMMILSEMDKKWEDKSGLVMGIVLGLFFALPWLIFVMTIQRSYQPIQNPIMFIPVPLLCFIGLYWIKWWVISSSKTITFDAL
jgi:hypothetical protein